MLEEVAYIVSQMMRILGLVCLAPMLVAFYYNEQEYAHLFFAMFLLLFVPFALLRFVLRHRSTRMKHAMVAIAITWFAYALVSAVPFWFAGYSLEDSFFESMSGWTSTGLSVLRDPSLLPRSLSFWRGFIQWLSGLGVVVMALLVFERPATAGALFAAEGRTEDFYLNLYAVAKTILGIYFVLSLAALALFLLAGVPAFDAFVHAMTTISAGGFSTNTVGVGWYGSGAMIVAMFVMLAAGISFVSHRELLRLRLSRFLSNPEVQFLFALLAIATALIALDIYSNGVGNYLDGAFYALSALSATGASAPFPVAQFPQLTTMVLILLMLFGASYGSVTGGLKLWRVILLYGVALREIRRHLLPRGAALPLRIGDTMVQEEVVFHAVSYTFLYVAFLLVGSVAFTLSGFGIVESIFTVASAQGNIGLAVMEAADLPMVLKALLAFHMYAGRMEIIPFLVLLGWLIGVERV